MEKEKYQELSTHLKIEVIKQQELINSIDVLFDQVYDKHGKNLKNNPGLNGFYKNLSPVIQGQNNVEDSIFSFLKQKTAEITKELERVEKILFMIQKDLK